MRPVYYTHLALSCLMFRITINEYPLSADYRTHVSGIRPEHLQDAPSLKEVQKVVSSIITNRVLVGHSVHNDLKALMLSHPYHLIRDTSKFKLLCSLKPGVCINYGAVTCCATNYLT